MKCRGFDSKQTHTNKHFHEEHEKLRKIDNETCSNIIHIFLYYSVLKTLVLHTGTTESYEKGKKKYKTMVKDE